MLDPGGGVYDGSDSSHSVRLITCLVSMSMLLGPTAARSGQGFDVIFLGVLGCIQDGNLSSSSGIHLVV